MALSSTSTLAQVLAQYDDNADYETDGSGAKGHLFKESLRHLMRRSPAEMASSRGALNQSVSYDLVRWENELTEVTKFLKAIGKYYPAGAAIGSGSGVRFLGVGNFGERSERPDTYR